VAKFKDTKGREWEICVSATTVKKVHEEKDIWLTDIASPDAESPYWKMVRNTIHFIEIIWFLIEKSAEAKSIDEDDFGGAMFGDVIFDARKALEKAISDFFQTADEREFVLAVVEKVKEGDTLLHQYGTKKLQEKDLSGLVKESFDAAMNLLESSPSIPAR